jgi:PAS domain S-box-containing protein
LFAGDILPLVPASTFDISSAHQGQEALALVESAVAEQRPFALAFVDVRMPPGWDGVETISRLWKVDPDLQVVICTAYSDYSWDEMRRTLGDSDSLVILKKPFDTIEVLQLANALTKKWRLTQQAKHRLQELDQRVRERTRDLEFANHQLQEQVLERARAEERFSKSFHASPIPIAILSLRSNAFIDANQSFFSMAGYERAEVLGATPESLRLLEPPVARRMREQLDKGEPLRSFDMDIRTRTGESRNVLAFGEIFHLGTDAHLLLILHDLTERLSLEQQLRQAQKIEAVGQLAAGVAHDFNNLLTVIQGHTSLRLSCGNLDPETQSSLRIVLSAAVRGAKLTQQLLAFSRKQTIQRKPLLLNELITALLEMLRRVIGEHIDLTCQFGDSLPSIMADKSNLEQVLMNLCVNARDAMPAGGTLSISTACVTIHPDYVRVIPEANPGQFIRLTVSDTGCGMTSEVQTRAFEPFFTTKEVGKGTGMGLATVYGIVKQHNGWIELQSAAGQGTTFSIFLPVYGRPDEVERPMPEANPLRVRGGQEAILVVEDEEFLRDFVRMVLESYGYRVWTAANGVEAQEVWLQRSQEIVLLFTDMVMPRGVTGLQLAERLRAEKPDLKIVYTSGYSPSSIASPEIKLLPGASFLQKPYQASILAQTVRDCLEGRSSGIVNHPGDTNPAEGTSAPGVTNSRWCTSLTQ